MREIYTSPRDKNIDRVVQLFAEHGIETRVTNRAIYERPSYTRFSYAPGDDGESWPRVEVKYARDMTRARALLRDIGIAPMTRYAQELEFAREQRNRRSPQATARRIRTIVVAVLAAALVVAFMKMFGGV